MSTPRRNKERFVWSHSSREPRMYRRWWHWRGGGVSSIEVNWGSSLCCVRFGFDDESGWHLSARVPPVGIYLSTTLGRWGRLERDREIFVSIHGGSIHWSIWRDPMGGWDRSVPRWRDGSLNVVDVLLGPARFSAELLEEREVQVPMPEKSYPATAKLERHTWKRRRWFAKRVTRCSLEIPGGIPHPGKGTSSWNCGDDATFGMTTGPVRSIPDAVGKLVGSCLDDRVRYGGWAEWSWDRRS